MINDVVTNLNQTNAFEAIKYGGLFSTRVFRARLFSSEVVIKDLASLQTAVGNRLLEAIGSSIRDPTKKTRQLSSINDTLQNL